MIRHTLRRAHACPVRWCIRIAVRLLAGGLAYLLMQRHADPIDFAMIWSGTTLLLALAGRALSRHYHVTHD